VATQTNTPSRARTLLWGITLRCARCGSGHLFRGYFSMKPDCPRCGLHFEREQGYWTGALAFNMIATGGLFAIIFVSVLVATLPDIPVIPVLCIVLPIMLLGPIVFYPFSKTIWVAVDRAFLQRLDPNERFDERL
jgi:uncharacterized protein (DUF983 family)